MNTPMVAEIANPTFSHGHLRRIDMRRDLTRVADLVELCFSTSLDPEGKQYLREMRKAAQNASWLMWASSMIDEAPMPPSGFVWEEDGQLVGNLSLIPINLQGKRGYMIANVATHPDFRGRGIARSLTTAALDYIHNRRAAIAWLQVREDNPIAIHIYQTNGFEERFRRTSWYSGPVFSELPLQPGVQVLKRRAVHYPLQRDWLKRCYPPELEWHIPFDWNLFRVDLWGKIYRFLSLEASQHWSVEHFGDLQGVISWKHTGGFANPLWLAIPEQLDEEAIIALLARGRKLAGSSQPLSLNFPAGQAVNAIRQAGFYPHQTLIWMEYALSI